MRLLVVEDEPDLRRTLARALADEHFAVDTSGDGDDGLFRALHVDYDAIVLDLMLPRRSGEEVLERLRQAGKTTPVIVLTAKDLGSDRVANLNRGADDYLTKPFLLEELVARIHALIRRAVAAAVARRQRRRSPHQPGGTARLQERRRDRADRPRVQHPGAARHGDAATSSPARRSASTCTATTASSCRTPSTCTSRRSAASLAPRVIQTRRGLGYLIDG